jgi:hypothetical protein
MKRSAHYDLRQTDKKSKLESSSTTITWEEEEQDIDVKSDSNKRQIAFAIEALKNALPKKKPQRYFLIQAKDLPLELMFRDDVVTYPEPDPFEKYKSLDMYGNLFYEWGKDLYDQQSQNENLFVYWDV